MIEIMLFAGLKETVGKDKIFLNIEGQTVKQFKENGLKEYGIERLEDVFIAINEEYVDEDYVFQKEDVVAIIPPVSGG